MNNLKEILLKKKLSQKDFIALIFKKTGLTYSPSRVSRYINGKVAFMSSKTLKTISYTLDVPIEQILNYTP